LEEEEEVASVRDSIHPLENSESQIASHHFVYHGIREKNIGGGGSSPAATIHHIGYISYSLAFMLLIMIASFGHLLKIH